MFCNGTCFFKIWGWRCIKEYLSLANSLFCQKAMCRNTVKNKSCILTANVIPLRCSNDRKHTTQLSFLKWNIHLKANQKKIECGTPQALFSYLLRSQFKFLLPGHHIYYFLSNHSWQISKLKQTNKPKNKKTQKLAVVGREDIKSRKIKVSIS